MTDRSRTTNDDRTRDDPADRFGRREFVALGAGASATMLAGCAGGGSSGSPDGSDGSGGSDGTNDADVTTGSFRLLISDAPADIADFDRLDVTLDEARVFQSGSEGEDDEETEEDDGSESSGNETADDDSTNETDTADDSTGNETDTSDGDDEEAENEEDDEEDEVEYFVEDELLDSVRTSVPKSVQLSQSSSSAPSTFVVVSDELSAPHISHWGIPVRSGRPGIKDAPRGSIRTGRSTRPRTAGAR